MKVTIKGVIFEGSSDEIYEILNRLGYLSKLIQPIEIIKKEDLPSIPATWAQTPIVPYWTHPYTVGDPSPGILYPNVWCGTDSTITSLGDDVIGKIPTTDDLDKLNS